MYTLLYVYFIIWRVYDVESYEIKIKVGFFFPVLFKLRIAQHLKDLESITRKKQWRCANCVIARDRTARFPRNSRTEREKNGGKACTEKLPTAMIARLVAEHFGGKRAIFFFSSEKSTTIAVNDRSLRPPRSQWLEITMIAFYQTLRFIRRRGDFCLFYLDF
jgi:hypothetical protein